MPRYRNTSTGVVVDIPAELAASIGSYEPVGVARRGAADGAKKPGPKPRARNED